jgi:hypothetical protein
MADNSSLEKEVENPFLDSVCRTPWDVNDSVDGLNAEVLDQLIDAVGLKSGGPLVMLTAPRAGYGKTHLLGRVAAAAANQAIMVPLAFRSGDTITLTTLNRRGIESLQLACSEIRGWSRLRESSARIVATLMHRLIQSGQLPCANPTQAQGVLAGPIEAIFDPQGESRMIGEWISKNRENLSKSLAILASKEVPLPLDSLDAWLGALLELSLEGGNAGLADMQTLCLEDKETGIPAWLRLLALWRPVVLLVDHLDGFYRNPQAGVDIATLLMDLVDFHQVHVLLSLNQDVWQATFGHHLPSALEDRLTSSQVLLRGLTENDAASLLRLRLEKAGLNAARQSEFEAFVSVNRHFLGRPIGSVSARAFLRHCARQWEIFQVSPPSPENAASEVFPALDPIQRSQSDAGIIPLKQETVSQQPPGSPESPLLPTLFDTDTQSEVQLMAESLSEPRPAIPQDEPADPITQLPCKIQAAVLNAEPEVRHDEGNSTAGTTNQQPQGPAPSADAFVKLREMLARLRKPGSAIAATTLVASPFKIVQATEKVSTPAPMTPIHANSKAVNEAPQGTDLLHQRFQSLRQQLSQEVGSQPLDHRQLAELIRLAGRRFPLVRFSEHELPGLTGRYAMYWALQGVEILFGLASFTDAAYWRTLSGFAAGRLSDLAAQTEREGFPSPKLKLVSFKTEVDQFAWQNLLNSQIIAGPLAGITDVVELDSGNVAALYAMQRIIKESEAGILSADPTQVMTVLARELDFFWKRITRVA